MFSVQTLTLLMRNLRRFSGEHFANLTIILLYCFSANQFEVVKSFWPRVCSIFDTDIPIHLVSIHHYMHAA